VSDVDITITGYILLTGESQLYFAGRLSTFSIANYRCTATFNNRGATMMQESVPKMRYQGPCNNALFDPNCHLSSSQYRLGVRVSLTSNEESTLEEREVVVSAYYNDGFGESLLAKPDAYFIGGTAYINGHYRDISGAGAYPGGYIQLTLQYSFPEATAIIGSVLALWPGCNKSIEHCIGRFNNLYHFAGFPYIPSFSNTEAST